MQIVTLFPIGAEASRHQHIEKRPHHHQCEVFTIATTSAAPAGHDPRRSDRLGFLGLPKFGGLIAVVGVVIAVISAVIGLLAYLGDESDRRNPGGITAPLPAPGSTQPATPAPTALPTTRQPTTISPTTTKPATTASTTAPNKPPQTGVTTSTHRLAVQPIDARTVEVTVTPPARPSTGRDYWFFVEIDWRDGNTDYYPREKLTGNRETFMISIPPDATLDADRTGRIYALTADQSADAQQRLERQRTSKDDDFFGNPPGTAASASVTLPFGN